MPDSEIYSIVLHNNFYPSIFVSLFEGKVCLNNNKDIQEWIL
jgi:hypothetical protein